MPFEPVEIKKDNHVFYTRQDVSSDKLDALLQKSPFMLHVSLPDGLEDSHKGKINQILENLNKYLESAKISCCEWLEKSDSNSAEQVTIYLPENYDLDRIGYLCLEIENYLIINSVKSVAYLPDGKLVGEFISFKQNNKTDENINNTNNKAYDYLRNFLTGCKVTRKIQNTVNAAVAKNAPKDTLTAKVYLPPERDGSIIDDSFIDIEVSPVEKEKEKKAHTGVVTIYQSPEILQLRSWKFHISMDVKQLAEEINADSDILTQGLGIVIDELVKGAADYQLEVKFKISNIVKREKGLVAIAPESGQGRVYYGAQVTVYVLYPPFPDCDHSLDEEAWKKIQGEWLQSIKDVSMNYITMLKTQISKRLTETEINPGIIPASDAVISSYVSLRNDNAHAAKGYKEAKGERPGNFNPKKAQNPFAEHVLQFVRPTAKSKQPLSQEESEIRKQQTQAIAKAVECYNRALALPEKKRADNERLERRLIGKFADDNIKTIFTFIKKIAISIENYPDNTENLLSIFTKKHHAASIDDLKTAFEIISNDKNCDDISPSALLIAKDKIFEHRYHYKQRQNRNEMLVTMAKYMVLILAVIPILFLPFWLVSCYQDKKKKDEEIDVQPLKCSKQEVQAVTSEYKKAKAARANENLYFYSVEQNPEKTRPENQAKTSGQGEILGLLNHKRNFKITSVPDERVISAVKHSVSYFPKPEIERFEKKLEEVREKQKQKQNRY